VASLFEMNGGQPQKQPKYVPIFIDRTFTGMFTQRSIMHDPSDVITAKFYGGRPDALWTGSNVELTNRLTLQRRPGLTALSTFTYPTPPLRAYPFQLTDGTIRLMIDTQDTGALTLTSCANASAGTTVYTGTITGGGSNAFAGYTFTVTGFDNTLNNTTGTPWLCTASSTTTLTLQNPFGVADTHAASAISYGAVYYDQQNGTSTILFAKGQGAGQTAFLGVGGILYMGDGVDTRKYTPLNPNINPTTQTVVNPTGVSLWNWGTPAPSNPPTVTSVSSGASAVNWQANTVWSTMGLIYDSGTSTIQQINSVNGNPSAPNATQFGTTATGQPAWNNTPGGTTTDNTVTWTNRGPVGTWMPNTLYQRGNIGGTAASPCIIYDPTSKACYYNANSSSAGTSGSTKPVFKAAIGQITQDGGIRWAYLGNTGLPGQWQSGFVYATESAANASVSSVTEPVSLATAGLPASPTVYWQVVTTGGTSASSGSGPTFSATAGATTGPDGNILWMSLGGTGVWAANTAVTAWYASGAVFSAIKDSNSNFQVCVQSGTTTTPTHPTWATAYGDTTVDGTAIWVCVGASMVWAASTIWYLPASGFFPPQGAGSYGGASVVDSNSNIEFAISSGKGGSSTPSWASVSGGTAAQSNTTDNAATWYNLEHQVAQSLVINTGFSYGYSYKSLAFDDFYAALPLGDGKTPPGITSTDSGGLNNFVWTGVPIGSATELISTSSPAFTQVLKSTGAVNTISGAYSTDPQIDTIVIWRSLDGGGEGSMFELTEIPNSPTLAAANQPWVFRDFLPDLANASYPGLDTNIPAPIDSSNDPPPITYLPMVYNFTRIWGADGTAVPFSGGPDVLTGNPNEAFAPADNLPFLSPVVRLVKTPQGTVTFLKDSIEIIAGGPLTSSFFSVTWAPGIGLQSFNALDVLAGEIYFYAADLQFRIMTPSLNISQAGFPIGDQLSNMPSSGNPDTSWDPAQVYVASHQSGIDNCVMIADGNTGWYRLNPRQAGAQPQPEPIWSPYASITNGCQMVQSVETTPGVKKLLVGGNLDNKKILYRDLTVYADDSTQYDAFFIMGSIKLASPGQLALLKFLEMDFSGAPSGTTGYRPTISYLLDEIGNTAQNPSINPTFTAFTAAPQFDPPSLYGKTTAPTTYSPNRYYFLGNASLARCRHLQIKVDFGTTNFGDEILNTTIFGRIMVET
jgi:hypothetical protein